MNLNKLLITVNIYLMAAIVFTAASFYGFEMLMGPNDLIRTFASFAIGFFSPIGLALLIDLHMPATTAMEDQYE